MSPFGWPGNKKTEAPKETLPHPVEVQTYSVEEYESTLRELQEKVIGTEERYFVTHRGENGAIEQSVLVEDHQGIRNGH